MADDERLERSRRAFEAAVDRRLARAPAPAPVGKGSPGVLLATGFIGTALLGLTAWALGGGALLVPAAIPLATVVGVLVARRVSSARSASRP